MMNERWNKGGIETERPGETLAPRAAHSPFPIPHSPLPSHSPFVIGLIGGIGSGKSAVAAEFARHGAAVISGDQLGHEALQQPDIRAKVIAHFGPTIIESNGDINRRKLGAIVFADLSKLRGLEKIVFP